MGYTTEFEGRFTLNKPLDAETADFLRKFSETRRMARKLDPKYGVEGEFYVDGGGEYGQAHEPNILNYNSPPRTQPGLWCQWAPTEDNLGIEWNGAEKFYHYVEWLKYLIANFIAPKGYVLGGEVKFQGEEMHDAGIIKCSENTVKVTRLRPVEEEA